MLEELHLAQTLFRFRFAFVGAAEIFALFGENFVAALCFFDQLAPPALFSANGDRGPMPGLL
jgi:hypothetical protein